MVYGTDGNYYCPHCDKQVDMDHLTSWRYGKEKGGYYWYKYICGHCGHYIMTYRDSGFDEVIKKNIKEVINDGQQQIVRDKQGGGSA